MREHPARVTPSIRSHAGPLFALVLAAELALAATVGASEPDIARPAVDPSRRVHQEFVAQSADPASRLTTTQRISNPCPPGHRIEFAFGDTSLLIDPEWMKFGSIAKLNDLTGGVCPKEPISEFSVFIYSPPPAARRLFVERGLPDNLLIEEVTSADPLPSTLHTNPSTRRYLSGGGYIEDVTDTFSPRSTDATSMRRNYRLQLPATPTDPDPTPFIVSCAGVPDSSSPGPGRGCSTGSFRYGADIIVRYRFRQDRHNARDERWLTPDGSISEPDGFLAMAARLRDWLDKVRKTSSTR